MSFSFIDATAWSDLENCEDIALVIHDHPPVPNPQTHPLTPLEESHVIALSGRVLRVGLDLGTDQHGRVSWHPAQSTDRGFRVTDLLHGVA
jgi:hypothetical protein